MENIVKICFLIGLIANDRVLCTKEAETNPQITHSFVKNRNSPKHLIDALTKGRVASLSLSDRLKLYSDHALSASHARNRTSQLSPHLSSANHYLTPARPLKRFLKKRSTKTFDKPQGRPTFKFRHHLPGSSREFRESREINFAPASRHSKHSFSFWKSDQGPDHESGSLGSTSSPQKARSPNITWGRAQTHTASFDDPNLINVTARDGEQARLPCTVLHLGQAKVSWIRQRDLHILAVGRTTYTTDQRFQVLHGDGSLDWTLIIGPVTQRDAGIYECQVSTKPKIYRPVNLIVSVEKAEIQGPAEVFIRNGSTISLTCIVKSKSEDLGSVAWMKKGEVLDYDSPRGGISLEVEKTPTRATTKLFITKARKVDSGVYICSPQFAQPASVTVHVVNGEESAAVQTNAGPTSRSLTTFLLTSFCFTVYLACNCFHSISIISPAEGIVTLHFIVLSYTFRALADLLLFSTFASVVFFSLHGSFFAANRVMRAVQTLSRGGYLIARSRRKFFFNIGLFRHLSLERMRFYCKLYIPGWVHSISTRFVYCIAKTVR